MWQPRVICQWNNIRRLVFLGIFVFIDFVWRWQRRPFIEWFGMDYIFVIPTDSGSSPHGGDFFNFQETNYVLAIFLFYCSNKNMKYCTQLFLCYLFFGCKDSANYYLTSSILCWWSWKKMDFLAISRYFQIEVFLIIMCC